MSPRAPMALGALAVIALIAGGWMTLLAPKRTQMSAVQEQITQAQARVATANTSVARAEQARAEFAKDSQLLARLAKAVPADDDVGPLVRQLEAIARANKVDFRSAKLVGGGAPAAAPAPVATEGGGTAGADDKGAGAKPAGDTPADGASGAGAASATPVAPVVAQPPPGTVVGDAGLLTVPFSFTFDGGYTEMQRFLTAVHALARSKNGQISVRGRLITIDGFSLGAGRDGFPKVKALVRATAYLLPQPAAATTATAPPATGAATTATAPPATGAATAATTPPATSSGAPGAR